MVKIFEGKMLIRRVPTTLLQIFRKIMFNSKVMTKSIIDTDSNFDELLHINGLTSPIHTQWSKQKDNLRNMFLTKAFSFKYLKEKC